MELLHATHISEFPPRVSCFWLRWRCVSRQHSRVDRAVRKESHCLGSKPPLPGRWLWEIYSTPLSLSFLSCKMTIVIIPSGAAVRVKWDNIYRTLRQQLELLNLLILLLLVLLLVFDLALQAWDGCWTLCRNWQSFPDRQALGALQENTATGAVRMKSKKVWKAAAPDI